MKNMTSVLVTALCNQPEAFASDLGDDQSRYMLWMVGNPDWHRAGSLGNCVVNGGW